MAIKKSVRLTDPTIKVCNNLTVHSGPINWSGSINAMAEQYELMINSSMPDVSDNELNALYCAYNGYAIQHNPADEAENIGFNISESFLYDEQVRHFLQDEEKAYSFIQRLNKMSLCEKLALVYKARSFWRQQPIVDDGDEGIN